MKATNNKMVNVCFIKYGSWDYMVKSPVEIKKGDYIFFIDPTDTVDGFMMEGEALMDSFSMSEDAADFLREKCCSGTLYQATGRKETF